MKKVALVKSQSISISNYFQCGLPWIRSVEQVAKILCCLLKIIAIGRFEQGRFAPIRIHESIIAQILIKRIGANPFSGASEDCPK
jgi:hypothetical protein